MKTTNILGLAFIGIGLLTFIFVGVRNSDRAGVPLVFSEKNMLDVLWNDYKQDYIEEGTGRALDKQQQNITTSEGQSYTLLRAVWMDDKPTFDLALKWTMDNLKRDEDDLFSWLFGQKADGTYGVLSEKGGYNSATDADSDIALALIFAHERWGDDYYLETAEKIIASIWEHEVMVINGAPYLLANNLEKETSQKPIINPSYFSPYAYRIFAKIDPDHDWEGLIDTSYDILNKTATSTLDKGTSSGLTPDWIVISRATGDIEAANAGNLTTNYSYDALRTPWRIALDYVWYKERRAQEYLEKLGFLTQEWEQKGMLSAAYAHDGSVVGNYEAPALYGGSIGYFIVADPDNAEEVYEQKLKFLFNQDTNTFKDDLSYYDSNWVWFGIGLYNDLLTNLAE